MRTDVNVYFVKDNNGSNNFLVQVCGEQNQIETTLEPKNEVILVAPKEKNAPEVKRIKMVEEDLNQIEES